MSDKPIIFSAPMIRAILAGTKTQTRRVVKWRGVNKGLNLQFTGLRAVKDRAGLWALESDTRTSVEARCDVTPCPYGQPCDKLWVRESHWFFKDEHDPVTGYFPPTLTAEDVEYRADGEKPRRIWRPSIHMPRWASRITLEVTGVRVERLQSISEADAIAEGMQAVTTARALHGESLPPPAYTQYADLWTGINGPGSWDANPWIWCVEFRRLEP